MESSAVSRVQQRTTAAPVPRLSILGLLILLASPVFAAVVGSEQDWSAGTQSAVALVPMWTVVAVQTVTVQRALGAWMGFFVVLTLPQVGHLGEHAGQLAQIHGLGTPAPQAHGAVGALDLEWVHFLWNAGVLMGVLMLLWHFRRNPWLWATVAIALWHTAEHLAIMVDFWSTGKAGDPGLLSKGGAIAGGTPLIRPDMHFLYSLAMTAPLVGALVYQLRRCRDERESRPSDV